MDMRGLRNNTTLFILPLLDIVKEEILNNHFINAFLSTDIKRVHIKTNNGEFTLPLIPAIQDTIRTFTNGHYSRFPNQHKQKILEFWELSKGSKLHNILYPKRWELIYDNVKPRIGEVWKKPTEHDYYLN